VLWLQQQQATRGSPVELAVLVDWAVILFRSAVVTYRFRPVAHADSNPEPPLVTKRRADGR
jgi:hypothetical protein